MMKITIIFFIVALAAISASPAKGSTKASLQKEKMKCTDACTDDYTPVCGGDGSGKNLSFGNECVLKKYNCENQKELNIVSKGECPGGGGVRLS